MTHHQPDDHDIQADTADAALDATNERPPGGSSATADGPHGDIGKRKSPTSLATRRRRRSRPVQPTTRLLELTPAPSALFPNAPKTWLLNGWAQQRERYFQRLGEWAALQMKRLNLSPRDLGALAAQTGEAASYKTFWRLARQQERESHPGTAPERINFSLVLWLMTLSGQSFGDLGEFLRTGSVQELEPERDARADTLRAAYLALSPDRARSLEEFTQFLYQMDAAERTLIIPPVFASAATLEATADEADEAARAARLASATAEVLHVEAHLRDAADRLRAREANGGQTDTQHSGQSGARTDEGHEPPDDTHKRRRRQSN